MSKDFRNLARSHFAEYLMSRDPSLKINKTSMFQCPFKHNHDKDNGKPSAKIYPQFGYVMKCYNSACGNLGNVFDVFRKLEPDMAHLNDNEIADYLVHLLDLKENEEIDTLLNQYYNSNFYCFPLRPADKTKSVTENKKIQKEPIQGESWKKNSCHDFRKWKEWLNSGLGLAVECGKKSKMIVLDIDDESTEQKMKPYFNETLAQKTEKGLHRVWEYDEDFDFINRENFRFITGDKMDLQVNNSYIVVAPTTVGGYIRTWNNKKIEKMPEKLKKYLLDALKNKKQSKEKDTAHDIQKAIDNEDVKLTGEIPEGQRDAELTKIGGLFRKTMNSTQVLNVLSWINKNCCKPPLSFNQVKKIVDSLKKYDKFDKKELANIILEHLQLESVRFANTHDLTKSLGYSKKEIEDALDWLVREQKVVRIGKHFKALNKVEWVEDFMDRGEPINFKVPFFDDYVRFRVGSLIVVGGKSGRGKTTLSINILKYLIEQGIKPYYISTEAGSNYDLVCASLGLKEGDFFLPPKNKFIDPFSIELEDNAVTIIDWLKPPESEFAKTDTLYERINNQLTIHGGVVIAFAQLKNETELYAEQMIHQYASLVAIYQWGKRFNDKTKEVIYDNENTHLEVRKARDSKIGIQYFKIPTRFDKETKRITLRKN